MDLPGLTVQFRGQAEDFDQFVIDPISGTASGVGVSIRRPQEFAAASPLLVSANAANRSEAEMTATTINQTSSTGLPSATDTFSNDGSIISATQFLTGGPVTVIPAEYTSIDLFSLSQQSSINLG